jgi:fimbrial chaperone protein
MGLRALAGIGLLSLGTAVAASQPVGTFTISPVGIWLTRGQTSAAVNVTNSQSAPMAIQAQIFRWTQDGDRDVLAPTSDAVLSPPMATVPSGSVQTLRLLMRPSSVSAERHYRLLISEIPQATKGAEKLNFVMRSSIPVVASSGQQVASQLQWSAAHGAAGVIALTVTNTGEAYDKILAVTATMPDGAIKQAVVVAANPYVLPGAQRRWNVFAKTAGGTIRLEVTSRAGRSNWNLPVTG